MTSDKTCKVNKLCLFLSVCFRNIFSLVKCLDDRRKSIKNVADLFASAEYQQGLLELIERCEQLMFVDFESLGRKAREILWRKGYYEPISICRKVSDDDPNKEKVGLLLIVGYISLKNFLQVEAFLVAGIRQLKTLILNFDKKFNLDTINLALIQDQDVSCNPDILKDHHTMEETRYAWDIVHLTMLSIGDLYRYYLNFKFPGSQVTRDTVAAYYREAFKLNEDIGLAQNQLGTLFSGQNYEIDSIFYYLFAMACKEPCELSEANVNRVFQKNALFLEQADNSHKIKSFASRFVLIVDIFYYDKDVTDFCDLCHSFLIDLKYFLDAGDEFFTEDMLFKITAILLLCLDKLKRLGSKKVHNLNAVLVALVAEFVDNCNRNFELLKSCKEGQNLIFNERYNRIFAQFETFVAQEKLKPKIDEEKVVIMHHTPEESGSSNKENTEKSDKPKPAKRRAARRRRGLISDSSDSDDDDLSEERFHFSDSDSDVSFESYDSSDSEDEECDVASDSGDEVIILEEEIIPPEHPLSPVSAPDPLIAPFDQLSGIKFRRAYRKIDPNIVLEFAQREVTLKSLKILFNWLETAPDLIVGCYQSNPEFIHKIMRLINVLNIDIFTRKVYFDRSFITALDLRTDLRHLFDTRTTIAVDEDHELKQFALLQAAQQELNYERKDSLSPNEVVFLRLFKIVDFGFFLSKIRKFQYYFCAKTRVFIEKPLKNVQKRPKEKKRVRNRGKRVRDKESDGGGKRRSYLRNRNGLNQGGVKEIVRDTANLVIQPLNGKTTGEKMNELWLRSEVKTLEKEVKSLEKKVRIN